MPFATEFLTIWDDRVQAAVVWLATLDAGLGPAPALAVGIGLTALLGKVWYALRVGCARPAERVRDSV